MEANSAPIRQSGMFHQRSSHRQALQKSMFSRLGSRFVLGYPSSQSGTAKNTDNSNLTGLNSSVVGIDLSINLGPNYTMATRKEVIVEHPDLAQNSNEKAAKVMGRLHCSRCLSTSHSKPNCTRPVRCGLCFRLGHIVVYCRFLPRFLGLSRDRTFSTTIQLADWHGINVDRWFSTLASMTDGTNNGGAPVFANFQDMSRSLLGINSTEPPITIAWIYSSSPAVIGDGASPSLPASASSPPLPPPGSSLFPAGEAPQSSSVDPVVLCSTPWLSLHCEEKTPNATVNPLQEPSSFPESTMANKLMDPSPFMPHGYHCQMVGFRKPMTRVVLGVGGGADATVMFPLPPLSHCRISRYPFSPSGSSLMISYVIVVGLVFIQFNHARMASHMCTLILCMIDIF